MRVRRTHRLAPPDGRLAGSLSAPFPSLSICPPLEPAAACLPSLLQSAVAKGTRNQERWEGRVNENRFERANGGALLCKPSPDAIEGFIGFRVKRVLELCFLRSQ